MKQIYTLLACCLLFQLTATGQCTDLFFSEYIEGSSNNKALEIFNPTDAAIDLGSYQINRYNNGNTSTSGEFNFPSGFMLAPNEVYVVANSSSDPDILAEADTTSTITFYNGDDAIELIDTVTGNSIDIIGVIGEDPGSSWPVGAGATGEHTLVRNANVNDPQTDWTLGALEWDVYPQDSFTFLGSHAINSCDIMVQPPIVSFAQDEESTLESGGSITVDVNISNLTNAVDLEIALDASSTTDGSDATVMNLGTFSFAADGNDTSITVTVNVIDDSDVEGNEELVLKLINVTAGTTVTFDTYTLAILDDDVVQNNPCADLFFSEYVEGSSNNKAIEVFNPTDAAIDLGLYQINKYRNGDTDPDFEFYFPSGEMLAPGAVYVIANSQADSANVVAIADTVSNITFFNGDDAMALLDTTTQTALDIIGVIGEDPGASWPVGTGATAEFTLVRKASVNEGFTNWAASSLTWDVYARDSFTFLGSHMMTPCDTTPDLCENVTISITPTVVDESVEGANDGTIDLSVSGGTEPYTYSWSNGATTKDITDLMPGEYTVTVTDSNGCEGMETIEVQAGPGPCDTVTVTVMGVVTDESADGADDGEIDISVSGGMAGYTYLWSNGATTEDITGLADGEYCVTVTDANGCATDSAVCFTVERGAGPCDTTTIVVTGVVTDETVLDADDGAIDISVSGGVAPYTYSWSNAATTEDVTDLPDGDYTVTVTDANGCEGSMTFTVARGVDPCASVTITVSLDVTDESVSGANDGAIDATVTGGTAPYTYNWISGQTTEDISGLAPNDYTLTAIDANGCRGSMTATVAAGSVGINEITSLITLNVFPNPVNDVLNVQLQFANSENVQLEITDVLGRNLMTIQPEQVLSKTYTIQTDFPSGIYFLKILVNENIAVETFIVE